MLALDTAYDPDPYTDEDDAALLRRLRDGELGAFDELVERTGGRMLAIARSMLGHDEDARDAVQDAYLCAFRSIDRFDGRSLLSTWLHRITVNACLMRLRTRRRRPDACWRRRGLPKSATGWPSSEDSAGAAWPDPSVFLQRRELVALLRRQIDELPREFREVLMLRDVHQLDTIAAADALKLSVPGVKTRLHRARRALRSGLDD